MASNSNAGPEITSGSGEDVDIVDQAGEDVAGLQAQMRERLAKDAAKGVATRNQQTLWDKVLEMRILLQKGLAASQRLPLTEDLQAVKATSQTCASLLKAMRKVCIL